MATTHSQFTGAAAVHPAWYIQAIDPGAVGAGKGWVDTGSGIGTTGSPYPLKKRNATNTGWDVIGGAVGLTGPQGLPGATGPAPYICIQDQKAQNTAGGTFTSGADRTRDLNTILANGSNLAVLNPALNQITLPAGTYRCQISAPAYQVNAHRAFLYNVTDAAVLVPGTSSSSAAADTTTSESVIKGPFSLRSPKVLEVRHRCTTTATTSGFGLQSNFGIEVYTVVEFWRDDGAPPFFGSSDPNPSLGTLDTRRRATMLAMTQHSLNTPPQ